MLQLLALTFSSILIGLLSTPRNTTLSKVILHSTLSFYLVLLFLVQITGYLDIFCKCGIYIPLLTGSLLIFSTSVILLFRNKAWNKTIQLPQLNISRKEWIIYTPICLFYLVQILINLIFFPDSYDGNAYHLPLAIKFLQNDSFSKIPRIWHYAMPANAESVFTFFSFSRNPILLNFSQLLLLIALIFWNVRFNKIYFGLSNQATRLCTVLLLSMPVVFQGTFFHYIDFFGTTFLYFSITSALLIQKTQKEKLFTCLFFCGLFYGAALGTKLTFIVFSPIICSLVLYAFYTRHKEFALKYTVPALTVCIVGVFLLSSFWFIRNYIHFNNPLFPLNVPILNCAGIPIESIVSNDYDVMFTGKNPVGWLLYPFSELHNTGEYCFSFGPLFGVVILPSFIVMAIHVFFKPFRKESYPLLLFTMIPIGTIALWYLFLSRQPRFVTIAPLLMTSCAGYAYKFFIKRKFFINIITFTFSLLLLLFCPIPYLSKAASCLHYHYLPCNWDACYKIPLFSTSFEKKCVINLNDETINFALYGPSFRNRVITSQEVKNTIYGEKLPYLEAQNLPPFTDEQIDILYRKYGDCYFYSQTVLNNRNLKLYSKGADRFPRIQWLTSSIYVYNPIP